MRYRRGFRLCGGDKGAMERTKFAVAPLTPSQHPPMQQCGYVCKNNESIQTKNFRKPTSMQLATGEGVQRAIAKPSGSCTRDQYGNVTNSIAQRVHKGRNSLTSRTCRQTRSCAQAQCSASPRPWHRSSGCVPRRTRQTRCRGQSRLCTRSAAARRTSRCPDLSF